MKVLALDFGRKTGWALGTLADDGSPIIYDSGTQSLKITKRSEHPSSFSAFHSWLDAMITSHGVTHVAYELVRRHAGVKAAHAWGGYYSITYLLCSARNVSITPVEVGTVKKNWTGSGNANKQRMIDEARRRGYNPSGDDEADALAILHTATSTGLICPSPAA